MCVAQTPEIVGPRSRRAVVLSVRTALYKLYLAPPARYSEAINVVGVRPDRSVPHARLKERLDPWLGEARWKHSRGKVGLGYRFTSEDVPPTHTWSQGEINTREHLAVYGFSYRPFSVESRWYSGTADFVTFELDELLATTLSVALLRDTEGHETDTQASSAGRHRRIRGL